MGVDAVIIYLGCVLAGCPVVSIADSFAAEEVASRLRIAGARAIFTQASVPAGCVRPSVVLTEQWCCHRSPACVASSAGQRRGGKM
jgi:acyl-coenzyme A synthetase/AMP-(fatty) acid ligase